MIQYARMNVRLHLRSLVASLIVAAATLSPAAPGQKCMLWRVTSGATTGYMIGSVHIGVPSMYPLPPAMMKAFDQSKLLMVEIDITDIDPGKLLTMVQEKGMYSGGDSLANHVSKETDKKLTDFAAKVNFPLQAIEMMRPWMASMMIGVLPALQEKGVSKDLGIDKFFLDRAKGKKKIESLESVEFQFGLLSSLPEKLQLVALDSALDSATKSPVSMAKIVEAWKSGDGEKLSALDDDKPVPELAEFERKLVVDRNPHMADAMEHRLKSGIPALMVVGTAHLIGPEGVVALLRKRGYHVDQLDTQGNPVPEEKPKDKAGK